MCRDKCTSCLSGFFFHYETNKILSVKSISRGLVFRLAWLGIIFGYVVGYVMIYKKGYQDTEIGTSVIISKVKGVSYTNYTERNVWDVADYVVPPQEDNAIFITTNALFTMKQSQKTCSQDPDYTGARCNTNADCTALQSNLLDDGVRTGMCSNGICEVYAWCPLENWKADAERIKEPLLKNVNNFTIFIKNNIEFRKYKVSRSNIPKTLTEAQLSSCQYDPVNDPRCPIFKIETILSLAKTKYEDIAKIGGVISFSINWDCNLDYKAENCFPTYSFSRLDVDSSGHSNGWNFRHANYYLFNDVRYRDLIKAYGIRFVVSVSIKAGKFDFVTFTLKIGSSLGILGSLTLFCDFLFFVFGPCCATLCKSKCISTCIRPSEEECCPCCQSTEEWCPCCQSIEECCPCCQSIAECSPCCTTRRKSTWISTCIRPSKEKCCPCCQLLSIEESTTGCSQLTKVKYDYFETGDSYKYHTPASTMVTS